MKIWNLIKWIEWTNKKINSKSSIKKPSLKWWIFCCNFLKFGAQNNMCHVYQNAKHQRWTKYLNFAGPWAQFSHMQLIYISICDGLIDIQYIIDAKTTKKYNWQSNGVENMLQWYIWYEWILNTTITSIKFEQQSQWLKCVRLARK